MEKTEMKSLKGILAAFPKQYIKKGISLKLWLHYKGKGSWASSLGDLQSYNPMCFIPSVSEKEANEL